MQDTLHALLGLQEIDRQIFQVESELTRLPKELEARMGGLAQREHSIAERTAELNKLRAGIKEIEDMATGLRQRQRKLENEAASQKIDAAMLASYQHEIRSVKRTVSSAEDDGIELVGQAETIEAAIADMRAALDSEAPDQVVFRDNVATETTAAQAKLVELQAERAKLSADNISPEHIRMYTDLLATREGEALALLVDQVCQGCYVSIPKNLAVRLLRGSELVQCPSCNRILHRA
jgi:uncharacterized protein